MVGGGGFFSRAMPHRGKEKLAFSARICPRRQGSDGPGEMARKFEWAISLGEWVSCFFDGGDVPPSPPASAHRPVPEAKPGLDPCSAVRYLCERLPLEKVCPPLVRQCHSTSRPAVSLYLPSLCLPTHRRSRSSSCGSPATVNRAKSGQPGPGLAVPGIQERGRG